MERVSSLEFIQSLTREVLMEKYSYERTLLHYLVSIRDIRDSDFAKSLIYLVQHGLDLNAKSIFGNTPSHLLCRDEKSHFLEIMCCMGADISLKNNGNDSCLSIALSFGSKRCVEILIANGARSHGETTRIQERVKVFEQSVVQCRDVIVILLGLKRRHQVLYKLDRFLISQVLAVEIWATRLDW